MPTPLPGNGDLVYTLGQVIPMGVMYLAPYVAGANTWTANAAPPSNARREIVSASRMMILPFLYARFRPLLPSASREHRPILPRSLPRISAHAIK